MTGEARVGLDDFVQKSVGPVAAIRLPEPGRAVRRGDALFALDIAGQELRFSAPLTGKVVHVNHDLDYQLDLMRLRPYEQGWICTIDPQELTVDLGKLVIGADGVGWYQAEARLLHRPFDRRARGRARGRPEQSSQSNGTGNAPPVAPSPGPSSRRRGWSRPLPRQSRYEPPLGIRKGDSMKKPAAISWSHLSLTLVCSFCSPERRPHPRPVSGRTLQRSPPRRPPPRPSAGLLRSARSSSSTRMHTEEFGAECVSCHHETVAASLDAAAPGLLRRLLGRLRRLPHRERESRGCRQVRGLPPGADVRAQPRDADREGRDPPQLLEMPRPRHRSRGEHPVRVLPSTRRADAVPDDEGRVASSGLARPRASEAAMNRRTFLKIGTVAGSTLVAGRAEATDRRQP
jgi:glycine cleavage system H lipoate-binding protein